MKKVTNENIKVKDFVQTVLIDSIGSLVATKNYYLSFGVLTQAIELIGAIIEDEATENLQANSDSNFDAEGKSRKRFHNALRLFSNANYLSYCPERKKDSNYNVEYDLYTNLRCGYAHQMKPNGKISVTTENESIIDGTKHLEIDSQTGNLILVSEILYRDLKEVCEKVISMINNGAINHTKAYGNFLNLTSYS